MLTYKYCSESVIERCTYKISRFVDVMYNSFGSSNIYMKCLFAIIQTALNTTISFYNTVNMTNRFIYNNEQVINNRNFFYKLYEKH